MSDKAEENISMNLKIITLVMSVIIGIFGFFITRTLSSIDNNIIDLRTEIAKRSEILNNHETRLTVMENKVAENSEFRKKIEQFIKNK